jgi:hypothetical protein
MARKTSLFHKAHYNIIAAQFSGAFDVYLTEPRKSIRLAKIRAIVDLALSMAKRFREDNEEFDPHKFLDACSGDADLYPLSELWESYSGDAS